MIRFFWLFFPILLISSPLQEAIDNAPAGSKIVLSSGVYEGNIVISKPLIIDGVDGSAHIKGDGAKSVISINSSHVELKNLTISGSGSSHQQLDSAILADDASNLTIENNIIYDSLFGVNLQKVNRSKITDNVITSKDISLGLRGDGIRLWYAHNNIIYGNKLTKVRDLVMWYSSNNTVENNSATNSRYSLHLMYSMKNIVRGNYFENNSVGIFFMFSSGVTAMNNTIKNSIGVFGVGIGLKDSSDMKILNNNIIYNARGLYVDQSPYQPNTVNVIEGNNFLYNSNAIEFQGVRERSIFTENRFLGNMETVVNTDTYNNLGIMRWHRNYWDMYEGFDRDLDGVGDVGFEYYSYADRLWQHKPEVKFFYGSVVMDLINFLAKIAPFSKPELLATDNEPLMRR